MVSRLPPSRRSPDYAIQRVVKAVRSRTPGTGRVAAAAPLLPQQVDAKFRGKPGGGGTTIPDGTTVGDAYIWDGTAWQPGRICEVGTTPPSSPYTGQFFYDTDDAC